ncbi:hypothetical protein [Dictyobacter arantiisoli]|uniref:Uncharacterized protein n=1 Tax=Dictyobacter arantiisoli TaxID=2014874 RepID=A0A5A5T9S9_9CHLR|nr:hypothetical protein [Dictyobacter arantiisoli]GCF08148.1 hypothetical protein KDI_17120 [Dictyobacter arantiisoli]
MMYYRVAFYVEQTSTENRELTELVHSHCQAVAEDMVWKWRSTLLTSPHALLTLLRAYSYIPKELIRVFFASSEAEMEDMLARQNEGTISSSVTAEQFLSGTRMNTMDVRRLEFELSSKPDHDKSYTFALPLSMLEMMAWAKLVEKRRQGLLES